MIVAGFCQSLLSSVVKQIWGFRTAILNSTIVILSAPLGFSVSQQVPRRSGSRAGGLSISFLFDVGNFDGIALFSSLEGLH
jgi:hypothetical protein